MNNITCDFEYADKLEKLGYPQGKSYFKFVNNSVSTGLESIEIMCVRTIKRLGMCQPIIMCDAPTASELMDWLPSIYPDGDDAYHFQMVKFNGIFIIDWGDGSEESTEQYFEDIDLANAAAKAAIYLLENKLMEVK